MKILRYFLTLKNNFIFWAKNRAQIKSRGKLKTVKRLFMVRGTLILSMVIDSINEVLK